MMNEAAKSAGLQDASAAFREARTASLSVLDFDTGGPLGALVNVAVTADFRPIILDRDGRASVMVTGTLPETGDALTGLRATLTGVFTRTDAADIAATYLTHHPYAELYAGFGDFGYWVMQTDRLYVVAGFGKVFNYPASEMVALS
jgi:heme iron utilization protein